MQHSHSTLLKNNGRWLVITACVLQLLLVANFGFGRFKPVAQIDWWDVIGEGGAAALGCSWLLLILSSRPGGRVTNLLMAGLLAIQVSLAQDFLDELLVLPAAAHWDAWVESLSMPVGMVVVTAGLYLWRREQLVVLGQLRKRERVFRQHDQIDALTLLPDVHYLKQQLALEQARAHAKPFVVLLLDIDNFAAINRTYGQAEGDRLLRALSELLILNLRDTDLVCRYAGDRYALLLPETGQSQAQQLAQDLVGAIASFVFHTRLGERVSVSASAGLACQRDSATADLLEQATRALLKVKQSNERRAACA